MTRDEAEALIARIPEIEEYTIKSHSMTALRQEYEECFRDHSCESYVRLAKAIYMKGYQNKKLGQTDQRYMKRAEDTLHNELRWRWESPQRRFPTISTRFWKKTIFNEEIPGQPPWDRLIYSCCFSW